MGNFYDHIPENIAAWIVKQHMFWVATAPLTPDGHINVSPKGLEGTFHIVDKNRVWYEDLTGSGIETISHIRENGRITILFNAFDGAPRILRLFGKGKLSRTVHEFGTPEYEALLPPSKRATGSRSAIVIDVHKVGSSCGYAVPFYDFVGNRDLLMNWNGALEKRDHEHAASCWTSSPDAPADIKETQKFRDAAAANAYPEIGDTPSHAEKGLVAYWQEWNSKSVDGLPGMKVAPGSTHVPISLAEDIVGPVVRKGKKGVQDGSAGAGVQTTNPSRTAEYSRLIMAFVMGVLLARVLEGGQQVELVRRLGAFAS